MLAARGVGLRGARVLLLGVTYKKDIADTRESAALRVLGELARSGSDVRYHDPLIPQFEHAGLALESTPLTAQTLAGVDSVILCAPHTEVDYDLVVTLAPLVLDTCNALKRYQRENVVPL